MDIVELLEAYQNFAHVRFRDGREDTVALRNSALYPRQSQQVSGQEDNLPSSSETEPTDSQEDSNAGT